MSLYWLMERLHKGPGLIVVLSMARSAKQQTGNLQGTFYLTRTKVLVPGTAPGLCTGVGRGTALLCSPRGGPSAGGRGRRLSLGCLPHGT